MKTLTRTLVLALMLLSAPSSALGKRLTGDFEATQLADIVAMIEQVLDVKVAVDE